MAKLKTELSNIPNASKFMTDASFNDNEFSQEFLTALKTMITSWLSKGDRNITLYNSTSNPKSAVKYNTSSVDSANPNTPGKDLKYDLQTYVKSTVSVKGGSLNVNPYYNEITFTTDQTQTNKTSNSTNLQNKIGSVDQSIDQLADELVSQGLFDNPLAKEITMKEHYNLLEEIYKVKKIMKL